jgi:hypothetical protein
MVKHVKFHNHREAQSAIIVANVDQFTVEFDKLSSEQTNLSSLRRFKPQATCIEYVEKFVYDPERIQDTTEHLVPFTFICPLFQPPK